LEGTVGKKDAWEVPQERFDPAATRYWVRERRKLKVPGASGIVVLSLGRLAVVHDDKGIYEVSAEDTERVIKAKGRKDFEDLEGICPAPEAGSLLVLSEAKGAVTQVYLDSAGSLDPDREPKALGRLESIGETDNKGWEGLDLLPGALTPDGAPRILAVHERDPRRLGVFRWPGLEREALLELPDELLDAADDLADIAVHPRTGHVIVASDESETLLELRLRFNPWRLEALALNQLELKKGEKAEALTFEGDTLWFATDGKARLYRLEPE
tara:strand:- start:396 stop:1205 length:810 start_codon:yes stop_codon:yes gene_type:complete